MTSSRDVTKGKLPNVAVLGDLGATSSIIMVAVYIKRKIFLDIANRLTFLMYDVIMSRQKGKTDKSEKRSCVLRYSLHLPLKLVQTLLYKHFKISAY